MHERKNFLYYDVTHTTTQSPVNKWKENLQTGLAIAVLVHFSWVFINFFLP